MKVEPVLSFLDAGVGLAAKIALELRLLLLIDRK
jgi:hypothetical protein